MKNKYLIIIISLILFNVCISVEAQPANPAFQDDNFYRCVIDVYNKYNEGNVSYDTNLTDEQLKTIRILSCSGTNKEDTEKIQNTAGLEKLIELTQLELLSNKIVNIDISKNTKLKSLDLRFNNLSSIDVSANTELQYLVISDGTISSIDVSKNLNLKELWIANLNLTSIDVTKNLDLEILSIDRNQFTTVDVSNNLLLRGLYASNNKLTSLDVSKNLALEYIGINNNQLLSFDLEKNTLLRGGAATSSTKQNVSVKAYKYNGKYIINLKELDKTLDSTRVSITKADGVSYDQATGIITLDNFVDSINYIYDTRSQINGSNRLGSLKELEVTLNLVDTKEEYVPSDNSSLEKSEIVKVPDTGIGKSLLIGIVASMCLFAGIGVFYIQLGQKRN